MKPATAALIALLAAPTLGAAPAQAQGQEQTDCFPFAPGCERLPRLLEDMGRDLAPLMDGLAARLDPWMRQLTDLLGDLSGWQAPEVLPNGDILIRRRPPEPAQPHQPPDQPGDAPATEPFEL